MFGSKKGNVFAGKATKRDASTGVFTTVTGPGLGSARTMDRGVFEKAVKSANNTLRETKTSDVRDPAGRRR